MDRRKLKKYLNQGNKLLLKNNGNSIFYDFKIINKTKYSQFYKDNFGIILRKCFSEVTEINLFYNRCYSYLRRSTLFSHA